MTLHEQRQNSRACYDEAIAAIRAAAWADCGGPPLSPAEIEAAMRRLRQR